MLHARIQNVHQTLYLTTHDWRTGIHRLFYFNFLFLSVLLSRSVSPGVFQLNRLQITLAINSILE